MHSSIVETFISTRKESRIAFKPSHYTLGTHLYLSYEPSRYARETLPAPSLERETFDRKYSISEY